MGPSLPRKAGASTEQSWGLKVESRLNPLNLSSLLWNYSAEVWRGEDGPSGPCRSRPWQPRP